MANTATEIIIKLTKDYTQEELADILKLDQTTISEKLRNNITFTLKDRQRLIAYFDLDDKDALKLLKAT